MSTRSILVATWEDGLFRVDADRVSREIDEGAVRGLTVDRQGRVLAIVGGNSLRRRSGEGEWREIARIDSPLSCCAVLADRLFVGTEEAAMLRVDPDGTWHRLAGFDAIEGRGGWYAGTAIVNGEEVGPPLGIRSMTATCDGAVLLANVHVGGIPRSSDGGRSWQPTIDIEADVHQVRAHPDRPGTVAAACASGLCLSRDRGATWTIERDGLHAEHCSAVAFGRRHVFVSASVDPFSAQGAVYRRSLDGPGPLRRLAGGLPEWTDGKVDTDCIAACGSMVAMIDSSGRLYRSDDDGDSWSVGAWRLPSPSALWIC